MKSYKKATLVAKNARSGSYAAGCPLHYTWGDVCDEPIPYLLSYCKDCERTY